MTITLSTTPQTAPCEVPSRVNPFEDYLYGAVTLGGLNPTSPDLRPRDTLWSAYFHQGGLSLTDPNGVSTVVLRQTNILEIAVAFDRYMQPTTAYVDYDGVAWLYFYDVTHQGFTTINLSNQSNSKAVISPRVCFDDRRDPARTTAQVILAYYDGNQLVYKSSQDQYTQANVWRSESDEQQHYLEQIAMGDNGRLQVITYVKDYTT